MELRKLSHEMKVATEEEVTNIIEQFKVESKGLVTYKTAYKTKTVKGEVVDSFYILTIVEDYTK